MVYHVEKTIRGKKYHYLIKNVRINDKWKKFTVYIGKGELSKNDIKKLKTKHSKTLEKKVENYLKSIDPLLGLLSEKEMKELEKIKQKYKKNYRILPKEVRKKHYEDFLVRFTYDTNAIEGSTVTLSETKLILLDRITPPNRTLREVREVENHKKAFDFVFEYKGDVNKRFVLKIHGILTDGILPKDSSGKFRKVQVVITGVEKLPPKPGFVDKEFKQLLKWYNKYKKNYHPVVLASYFHAAFEGIHPFIDFNGRTGRLLLNFILMKYGYPIVDIKHKDRLKYYEALRRAQESNLKSFVNLVVKYLKEELLRVK